METDAIVLSKWDSLIKEAKRRLIDFVLPEFTDKKYSKECDKAKAEDNFDVEAYINERYLLKWAQLIDVTKKYIVDSVPTGISDAEYDLLEQQALQDGFSARDYVCKVYLRGTKTKNEYVNKISKTKINGSMLDAIKSAVTDENPYCLLKYDGSSLAIYLNPTTGKPQRIVGCGNLNISNEGIDQTWKLINLIPKQFPKGILAIQCEALVDTDLLEDNKERARQKANGLINSKYCEEEVNKYLTLRAYRYWLDPNYDPENLHNLDYVEVLSKFPIVYSEEEDNHITFAPADVWTVDMLGDWVEKDHTKTSTGSFLNDGWVIYSKTGECIGALKYAGAGSGDIIKTTVKSIQWNDQTDKGKDSWSANVIVEPVVMNGVTIKKPSAGSVSKLIKNNITPGAVVSLVLANSTIPMVGSCISPGNGDYEWPTCECGYKMSSTDIYGSNLKCGNVDCTRRKKRMEDYINNLTNIFNDLDLNKLLVIDRFDWNTKAVSMTTLLTYVEQDDLTNYKSYLESFLTTELQKRNLALVYKSSFSVLRGVYLANVNNQ
jgi:hypothetical protein